MNCARFLTALSLSVALVSGFAAVGSTALADELSAPPPEAPAVEETAPAETPAMTSASSSTELPEFARKPAFAAAAARSSCTSCSSAIECKPICGGEVGFDFVCHRNLDCGRFRVCICL